MDDTNPDAITSTRFEHERGSRRFTLRDTALVVLVVFVGLLVCCGDSPLRAAQEMRPGTLRDVAVAVSRPPAWIANNLPFAELTDRATAWLSPDQDLSSAAQAAPVTRGGIPAITADAFDPAELGATPARRPLQRLLITGDSLAQPLDVEIARQLAGGDVHVKRDAHLGTGISKSLVVDWTALAPEQAKKERPDAIVMFIGANEGFPLSGPSDREIECCGVEWAAAYATRVRMMMSAYRTRSTPRSASPRRPTVRRCECST
jgi:hypothetical protein